MYFGQEVGLNTFDWNLDTQHQRGQRETRNFKDVRECIQQTIGGLSLGSGGMAQDNRLHRRKYLPRSLFPIELHLTRLNLINLNLSFMD